MKAIIGEIIRDHQKNIHEIVSRYMENKKVLDAGCGNGINAYFFHQNYGADVTLLDMEDIREKEAADFPFFKSSADKMPFKDGTFDVAFLQYVLHHIPSEISVGEVVGELGRVAKVVIIVEEIFTVRTDIEKAKEFDVKVNEMLHPGSNMTIYQYYNDEMLKIGFHEAGLKIIEEAVIDDGSEEDGYLQRKIYVLGSDKQKTL